MRLQNKVAIITGSSTGIGRATALRFAQEGAKVVVTNYRDENGGKEVADQIKKNGGTAINVSLDVTDEESVKNCFAQAVKAFGTVDILVNNAGILIPKPFMELTKKDWERTFAANTIGVFLCAQQAAKIMLEKKSGKIINIASVRGLPQCSRQGNMDYSASKAAVINLTNSLAKELAPYITVNAVAPGFTNTQLMNLSSPAEKMKSVNNFTYLKRLIEPEEIAGAVLFLASDEGSGMTGELIVMDAGYHLKS